MTNNRQWSHERHNRRHWVQDRHHFVVSREAGGHRYLVRCETCDEMLGEGTFMSPWSAWERVDEHLEEVGA